MNVRHMSIAAGLAALGLVVSALPAQAATTVDTWVPYCAVGDSADDGGTDMYFTFENPNDSEEYGALWFTSYGEGLELDGSRLTRFSDAGLTWWTDTSDPHEWQYVPFDGASDYYDFEIPEGATVLLSIGVTAGGSATCKGVA